MLVATRHKTEEMKRQWCTASGRLRRQLPFRMHQIAGQKQESCLEEERPLAGLVRLRDSIIFWIRSDEFMAYSNSTQYMLTPDFVCHLVLTKNAANTRYHM